MQSRCLVRHHLQVCSGVALDLSRVPVEVLELILSKLTDPVSQHRLAQVTWNIVTRASNEGFAKVREDFTITEKVPTSVFSWLA